MSATSIYRQLRANGEAAQRALVAARTMAGFLELTGEGYVRLRVLPDDTYEFGDFDCDHVQCGPCDRCRQWERDQAARNGVYGVIGEYRSEPCAVCPEWLPEECDHGGWETADSCWGFLVTEQDRRDPANYWHGYGPDIMSETMQAWQAARLRLVA